MASGNSGGFTLIEIVVSLAILGISMATVMQIFSGGLKNVHRIDMSHRAMNHSENVMNELLADHEIRQPMQLSGDLDEEFAYTAQVDFWQEPKEGLSLEVVESKVLLLSVQVDVLFKNDPRGKFYRTVCLKTVPTVEDSGFRSSTDLIQQLFGR